jgi:beta-galactosidase
MQPQVLGRDKDDGRVMDPEDIRVLTMTSFAAGATGVMNLRFRPLLDGPLFGAFGSYGMDGSRTERSDIASRLAKWANDPARKPLFEARPVQGDIGLLVIPEAQAWDYLLNANHLPETYRQAMWGAYRGFFDNGLQPDWVHIDDIETRDTIYAPYPIMLTAAHAQRLADWVERGGILISEATPGYFGDRGKVGTVQPNNGLDVVFGAREQEVEFMPDIGDRIRFALDGAPVQGGGFLQSYRPTTGQDRGRFADGRIAVVENRHGTGRTLLVGTNPGIGYFKTSSAENLHYFSDIFAWTGRVQNVRLDNPALQARLHDGPDGKVLWVLNPTRKAQDARVSVEGRAAEFGQPHWIGDGAQAGNARITVPPRDALVIGLAAQTS